MFARYVSRFTDRQATENAAGGLYQQPLIEN